MPDLDGEPPLRSDHLTTNSRLLSFKRELRNAGGKAKLPRRKCNSRPTGKENSSNAVIAKVNQIPLLCLSFVIV